MTFEAIEYAFRSALGNVKLSDTRQLLSILVAADFVRRGGSDEQYFCINRDAKPFMEFDDFDMLTFRLELTDFYNKEFPDIAALVKGLSK
jgi:hypothetical protein